MQVWVRIFIDRSWQNMPDIFLGGNPEAVRQQTVRQHTNVQTHVRQQIVRQPAKVQQPFDNKPFDNKPRYKPLDNNIKEPVLFGCIFDVETLHDVCSQNRDFIGASARGGNVLAKGEVDGSPHRP